MKASLSISAEKIDTASLENHSLLIQLDSNLLKYAAIDLKKKKIQVLEEFHLRAPRDYQDATNQLESIIKKSDVMSADGWKEIALSFTCPKFTLVPSNLFEESKKETFLKWNTSVENRHETLLSQHHKKGFVNIFAANYLMLKFFGEIFAGANLNFLPHSSLVIESALFHSKELKSYVYSIRLEGDHITIAGADNGKLIYCNLFTITKPEDVLYFSLLPIQNAGIPEDEVKVFLSGEGSMDNKSFALLKKYIPNIEKVDKPPILQLGSSFKTLIVPKYYDLFCMYLCS